LGSIVFGRRQHHSQMTQRDGLFPTAFQLVSPVINLV